MKNDVRIHKIQLWEFAISVKKKGPMTLHASRAYLYFVQHLTGHLEFFHCCTHTSTIDMGYILYNLWQHFFHDSIQFARKLQGTVFVQQKTFTTCNNPSQQIQDTNGQVSWHGIRVGRVMQCFTQWWPCIIKLNFSHA